MINLTEALDRFRTEHPEYTQSDRDLEIARAAILSYQRAMQATAPQFQVMTNFDTVSSNWQRCLRCGGTGNILANPSYSTTGGMVVVSETCPECYGTGGVYR